MDSLFEKRQIICKSLAFMMKRILNEFGINCRVERDIQYQQTRHVYNMITLQDGRTARFDLEEDLEFIQTNSKTRFFGITNNTAPILKQDLVPPKELQEIDKTTAEYIPWGCYFDEMLRILKFATKGMELEEKLRNVLDNLDVYVRDRSIGYREKIYYHNRILHEVFTEKELNKIHQIDCFRGNGEEREYISCIVLDKPKEESIVYLYSNETGRYEEITLMELANEVKQGLVPLQGVQGLRKYLSAETKPVQREKRKSTIRSIFPFWNKNDEQGDSDDER